MVHLDEDVSFCTVRDTMPNATENKITIVVKPTYTVGKVFENVTTQFTYDKFDLVLANDESSSVFLNDKKDKLLGDIIGFRPNVKNMLVLMPPDSYTDSLKNKSDMQVESELCVDNSDLSDDEIVLGESASPTVPDPIPVPPALPFDVSMSVTASASASESGTGTSSSAPYTLKPYSPSKPAIRYVGLVNQAMTCYLNSLLQALFMTPEFRNALYKWEFDGKNESESIPYQLQRLFLNLQTSSKVAVETTDLTRSFGWRSNEAWHQHDIQELCRVMFDALEKKFKDTEQSELINTLYEGKMIDYVKCLECCTEKSREDTFLDIPLPVRPFNSAVAYGSIEEALRAFVQPETLDGNNQYFCEKCNKKCDAHKGLKFKSFPYILTLHLKRFDFDYQTLHRIKLNDKVTFPQTLNLNTFVNTTDVGTFAALQGQNHEHVLNGFTTASTSTDSDQADNAMKYDDCSTTDSGAALEEDNCSGIATSANSNHNESDMQEDDEGIDMSTSTDNRSSVSNDSGPYLYELFAIMIHSGSASGGHYYAYIKEFTNDEWYCFNDQNVTTITQEDIQKSFGGSSLKTYYFAAYSSSTNAYMLMYRQIDPKRNASSMTIEQFPQHIKELLTRQHEKDEEDRRYKGSSSSKSESETLSPKVFFYNPALKYFKESKVFIWKGSPFSVLLENAHHLLGVEKFAPINRCRLVAYDHISQEIEKSLEGREKEPVGEVLSSFFSEIDFLLEVRGENETFDVYEPGGVTVKVFKVDLKTVDLEGPFLVRVVVADTAHNFRKQISKKLKVNQQELIAVLETQSDGVVVIKDDSGKFFPRSKVFVACEPNNWDVAGETLKKLFKKHFKHLTYIYISVPNTDREALAALMIPQYEPNAYPPNYDPPTPKVSPLAIKYMPIAVERMWVNPKVSGGGDSKGAPPPYTPTSTHSNTEAVAGLGNFTATSSGDVINWYPSGGSTVNGAPGGSASGSGNPTVAGSCESNSEDSSLSDGDRTLVETAAHDLSNLSSTSHSPQLSSPGDVSERQIRDILPMLSDEEEVEESELYFRACFVSEEECTTPSVVNCNITDLSSPLSSSKRAGDKNQKFRTLKVMLDSRMRTAALKRALEPYLMVPAEYFKIVRKYYNLVSFDDGEQVNIELGRTLQKDEHKAKIYYFKLSELNNESTKLPVVCEQIFSAGISAPEFKHDVIEHLRNIDSKYNSLTMENCRVWEKSGRSFIRMFQDDDILGTGIILSVNCEMVVQELDSAECPTVSEDSLVFFVRRWYPSKLELGPFQEIVMDKNSEIKNLLSELSGIPEENIGYYKENNSFPCTYVNVLNINSSNSWFTISATSENLPFTSRNGYVFFYKDTTEPLKELTKEERQELNQKEKARLERVDGFTTYTYTSTRREQALKIYLDSSTKKSDTSNDSIRK